MKIRVSWGLFYSHERMFRRVGLWKVKESKSAILGVHRHVNLCVDHSMHGRYYRPRCRGPERGNPPFIPHGRTRHGAWASLSSVMPPALPQS